ncbi:aldo/keto reductase [Lacibacterium aquatile]|uniref:Aldo/keto reductase n=1 Tax=Lacibacterium aquatile TaxID=1168082 RepID=A0ABW5DRI3_9PROT
MQIPKLGFGTFRMSGDDVRRMVPAVINLGYRHIDTAQIYGNEEAVGDGIKASGIDRADLFLTTKVWVDNFKTDSFRRSVEESLAKLQTDYVDLLLLHWPSEAVPLADQIAALNAVQQAGMARQIGVSNYSTDLMTKAISLSQIPLSVNQVEYHPYLNQTPVLAAVHKADMTLTAYYAMADGKVLADPVIRKIAADHGRSIAQIVLRWLVQQDGVTVLSKTVSEERAAENAAIFDFKLSSEDMRKIHDLARPDGRIVSPPGLAPIWD